MLALLRGNVDNLETNLDKIDAVAKVILPYVHDPADGPEHVHIPVPRSINKLRADPKISNLESNIGAGISLIKNIISDHPAARRAATSPFGEVPTAPAPEDGVAVTVYKKSNDQFFNEFLSKSDDLLAQTQSKLEKLGKCMTNGCLLGSTLFFLLDCKRIWKWGIFASLFLRAIISIIIQMIFPNIIAYLDRIFIGGKII